MDASVFDIHAVPQDPKDLVVHPISMNIMIRPLLSTGKPIESLILGDTDSYVERLPGGKEVKWFLAHSKAFPRSLTTHFNGKQYVSDEKTFKEQLAKMADCALDAIPEPFPYQRVIYEYMRYGTPNRGILLEHGLGSGKTRTVIMIAESFRQVGLDTLILTPAFLATNFIDEIYRWVPDLRMRPQLMKRFYNFVSYNAGGQKSGKGSVFEQLARLGIGFPDGHPDILPYIKERYPGLQPPINKLIVIEEAHGLNRAFSNQGSVIRRRLYQLLMMARDCKVVMMSGTPMISNPFELASMYNVLRGPIRGGRGTAMPTNEVEFIENYLDYDRADIKDKDGFRRRIIGLGSYFKGITEDATGRIYPRRGFTNTADEIVELTMSSFQSFYHDVARDIEQERDKTKKRKNRRLASVPGAEPGPEGNVCENYDRLFPNSSYRSRSRKASNFVFPTGTNVTGGEEVDDSGSTDALAKLVELNKTHGYFNLTEDGLKKYSIKMYTIYKAITTRTDIGAPHVVEATGAISAPEVLSCGCSGACTHDIVPPADQPLPDVPDVADEYDPDAPEEETLDAPRAEIHMDPEDPLINGAPEGAKFRDVFLSDAELDKKYGVGRWRVHGGPSLVYSFYNRVEGVGIFSKVLDAHGFQEFDSSDSTLDISAILRARRYAFIKGGMSQAKKRAVMRVFNSRENMHGQLIQVIFVTLAASEGISLFQLRQVHIMEPFWDNVTIRQVIGRAMRLRSHFYLPEDERSVFVQRYVAVRSRDDFESRKAGRKEGIEPEYFSFAKQREREWRVNDMIARFKISMSMASEEWTTDQQIAKLADEKDIWQKAMLDMRRSVAIDCDINRGHREKSDTVRCFTFPDERGNAFSLKAGEDKDAPLSTSVREREVKTVEIKIGTKQGIHFNEHRRIRVKGKIYENAIPVYERPGAGLAIDRTALILLGYLIRADTSVPDSKTMFIPIHDKDGKKVDITLL